MTCLGAHACGKDLEQKMTAQLHPLQTTGLIRDSYLRYLRTIYPFDREAIISSVEKTGRFLVVHEGPQSFGVGAELIATVNEEAFYSLEAPPARLTGADTVMPLARSEKNYLINTDMIVKRVRKLLNE